MLSQRSVFLPAFLLCFFLATIAQVQATTYTVKAAGGGNYTTISACAAVAVAGDTCDVYSGSYGGWTPTNNGNSGALITYQAHQGETVTVTSGVNVSGKSYIRIADFNFSSGSITGDNSTNHIQVDHNTFASMAVNFDCCTGAGASDNVISNNTINAAGISMKVYGDRNLIDANVMDGHNVAGDDCLQVGGTNVVIRNNQCLNKNGGGSAHVDFFQVPGGNTPTLAYSLIEGNIEKNCLNAGGNCHFSMVRTTPSAIADNLIERYNFVYNLNGSYGGVGYHGDGTNTTPNAHIYNNTIATESMSAQNAGCASFDSGYGVFVNNICYNTTAGSSSYSPMYFNQGGFGNGNLAFSTGYSGNWGSPYSAEQTYNGLKSQNPDFANYPADASLQATSPAIGAASALTTVSSGCGTSSIVVRDARFFQAGWGPDNNKVQGDQIRVGSSVTARIVGINYSNNILALGSSIACSTGDPVFLYSDSTGKQTLFGAAPNVGAFTGSGSTGSPTPPPPTGLAAIIN